MGWSGGSSLMRIIIQSMQAEVHDAAARERVYRVVVGAFLDEDCDTLEEATGEDPAYDRALATLYRDMGWGD